MKSFGVLWTDPYNVRNPLQLTYGNYGVMTVNCLHRAGDTWKVFAVFNGEFPTEAELASMDGLVITGSPSDAHDDKERWVVHLRAFLKRVYKRGQHKLLGLCFGHQILAHSLGGRSGPAPKGVGWEIRFKATRFSSSACAIVPGIAELGGAILSIYEHHRDQISVLPPKATLLASSLERVGKGEGRKGGRERCKIESFALGGRVLGVQSHPEFLQAYSEGLMALYADKRAEAGAAARLALAKHKASSAAAGGGEVRSDTQRLASALSEWLHTPLRPAVAAAAKL